MTRKITYTWWSRDVTAIGTTVLEATGLKIALVKETGEGQVSTDRDLALAAWWFRSS